MESYAGIVLNVSGGTGNTPLTINITTGETFTGSTISTTTLSTSTMSHYVVFENFWDNSAQGLTAVATTETVSLRGVTGSGQTGSLTGLGLDRADLILGFSTGTITDSQTFDLSTGTRVTSNLSLNYTSINSSGNVWVMTGGGIAVSDTLTWSTVPEPHHYAMMGGVACLGFAGFRRFRGLSGNTA